VLPIGGLGDGCTAGSNSPINVPMIASTANNSTIVNPECSGIRCFSDGLYLAIHAHTAGPD
jgi:hypothetical protein